MITFDQLAITTDGKYLIIDARIDNSRYFDNVYIDSVVIDSQDTYIQNGPSSNPVFVYEVPDSQYDTVFSVSEPCGCGPVIDQQDSCCTTDEHGKSRHIRLVISEKELGMSFRNNMLFVYVIAKGCPSPDTPCGYDNSKVMGVVVNLYPYYQSMMSGVREIGETCEVPRYFINNILRFKALELSIKTGNYMQAIKYWRKFFISDKVRPLYKQCGCYGRNN